MRGETQEEDMHDKVIRHTLEQINYIHRVTFTGGEPSIATDRIDYFLAACKEMGVGIGLFHMNTNGVEASREFMSTLLDLWEYADNKEGFNGGMGGVGISQSEWHREGRSEHKDATERLNVFQFTHNHEETVQGDELVKTGRAKENGFSGRSVSRGKPLARCDDEILQGLIYIATNGSILDTIGMSYEDEKTLTLGNVLTDDIGALAIDQAAYIPDYGKRVSKPLFIPLFE